MPPSIPPSLLPSFIYFPLSAKTSLWNIYGGGFSAISVAEDVAVDVADDLLYLRNLRPEAGCTATALSSYLVIKRDYWNALWLACSLATTLNVDAIPNMDHTVLLQSLGLLVHRR